MNPAHSSIRYPPSKIGGVKPLRALVINPYIYDFACYDLFSKPVGLLQIAAAFRKAGFEVHLIDCLDKGKLKPRPSGCGNYYSEPVPKPGVFKDIPRTYKRYGISPELFEGLLKRIEKPDIILVTSGMTYWYGGVFEVIDILKKKYKDTPVILGGIYATLCYEHAARLSGADFVFKGTGIKNVMDAISKFVPLKPDIQLTDYQMPSYELYQKLDYVTLRTSSGCPFKCSYCGWYLLDKKFSQRRPEEVSSEIEYFYKKMKIKNFAFYDEALFFNPENHITEILERIRYKNIRVNFYTPNGLHARFLDEELTSLLKKSNFIQPRLGFESSSKKRQKSTGGKVYNEELSRAVGFLRGAGYGANDIGIYVLMGLPDQSAEEMEETIRFAHSLDARVYIEEYSPIPGTPDYSVSGLKADCDPLLHNNSIFPLYNSRRYGEFQRLKKLNYGLNRRLN
jgi:hypothetical protein